MTDIERILEYINNKKFIKNRSSFDEEISEFQKVFKEYLNNPPQLQFFAINLASNELKIQDSDKKVGSIIIAIGVNYGQNCKASESALVKQDSAIKNMRQNIRKILGLNNFHLIMTNLSPWITNERWSKIEKEIDRSLKRKFLAQAERLKYINMLEEFKDIIWIGHTKSIEPELRDFMENILKLKNFYLTYNLSYPWYSWKKPNEFSKKI